MTVLTFLIAAAVAVIDQMIKIFVADGLENGLTVSVIPNILDLVYVENRGVAFGMFSDARWFFIIFTSLVIAIISFLIIKTDETSRLLHISCGLIIGGGLGNLIDRVFRTYVIDYLSLSFFPPVCNFADYCITAGTVLLIIFLLFMYKPKDKKSAQKY